MMVPFVRTYVAEQRNGGSQYFNAETGELSNQKNTASIRTVEQVLSW